MPYTAAVARAKRSSASKSAARNSTTKSKSSTASTRNAPKSVASSVASARKKAPGSRVTPPKEASSLDAPLLSDSSPQFWLESDITSDEDVARDTFGASRLRELREA
jgi:hypothetical protein